VLDTSDVDRYVNQPLPSVQLLDPVSATDIRRWAQGMQYPNPLHYDDEAAAAGPFGRLATALGELSVDQDRGGVRRVALGGELVLVGHGADATPGPAAAGRRRLLGYAGDVLVGVRAPAQQPVPQRTFRERLIRRLHQGCGVPGRGEGQGQGHGHNSIACRVGLKGELQQQRDPAVH
jgi:hypothetical protein